MGGCDIVDIVESFIDVKSHPCFQNPISLSLVIEVLLGLQ